MLKTRRQPGDRRWGLEVEFPLLDSGGILVMANRRNLTDRRRNTLTLEEWGTLIMRSRHR